MNKLKYYEGEGCLVLWYAIVVSNIICKSTFLHQFLPVWSPWTNLRGKPWRSEVSQVRPASLLWCSLVRMKEIDFPCHSPTKGLGPASEWEEEAAVSSICSKLSSCCCCCCCSFKGSSSIIWLVVFHVATVWKWPAAGKFKSLFCPASQTTVPSLVTMRNLNSMWSPPLKSKSHTHPFCVQFKGTLVFQEPNCLVEPRRATWSPNWTWWSNRTCRWTFSILILFLLFLHRAWYNIGSRV